MSISKRDLVLMVLQFLEEAKLTETMHRLETETGYIFNMRYLKDKVLAGEWEEVESYLRGYIKVNDNDFSKKTFFEIWRTKYMEALERNENAKALNILQQDLVVFSDTKEYKELAELLTLQKVRVQKEHQQFDVKSQREATLRFLTENIQMNPLFEGKLVPPTIPPSTLRRTLLFRAPEESPAQRLETPWSLEDLPTNMVPKFCQNTTVTSMDFHPTRTLLLVGSTTGLVTLWDLSVLKEVASKSFMPWEISKLSPNLKALLAGKTTTSVTRVLWSPDGKFIGVSFNQGLIHLYKPESFLQHREIEAHVGSVNDMKFVHPKKKQLSIVTCGDDKLIKVWDLDGWVHFTFRGHEAPVYSICPHKRGDSEFILSTDTNGNIKAWYYDIKGSSMAHFNAPSDWCTTLLYSADGNRLFCCGTSKLGNSSLMQITETKGEVKKIYVGLTNKQGGVVQFHSSKKPFLAVGEDGLIKFWHIDTVDLLSTTDAEGGLEDFPRLQFDKEGNLLAVSTRDGFKILANSQGLKSLQ